MKKLLFGSIITAIILSGCSDDKVVKEQNISEKKVGKAVESKTKVSDDSLMQQVKETTSKMTEKVIDAASTTKEKIEKNLDSVLASKKEQDVAASSNPKALYMKCAACHGQMAEKPALGQSKIIKDLDKEQIVVALQGYKENSYGRAMKGVMQSQVANLSDDDIDSLATYISEF